MIPKEALKIGKVIEAHDAKELYWVLNMIQQQYPHMRWQSGDQPTKWFPRGHVGGIQFHEICGDPYIICWRLHPGSAEDTDQWEDDVRELISSKLIPIKNPQ
jgi:hypothetical protein